MTKPVVLLDANVFPTTWLLDILLTLDDHAIIDAAWSERILDEARRAMVDRQHRDPDSVDNFMKPIRSMNPTHCIYGWKPLEAALLNELPDPDDRHVLAAAIVADADYIVTYNLKDFPSGKLSRHSITAVHPDEFLCLMLNKYTRGMLDVMDTVVSNKNNPPRTMGEEIAHLRKLRLNTFSDRLERLLQPELL